MNIRETSTARAWVDIDLDALIANYDTLLARAKPRVGALAVVKADAYGVGMCPVVRALKARAPWGYGVAALAEGVELREKGIDAPVVHFFCTPDELEGAAEAGITPGIGDLEALDRWRRAAARLGRRLPFHLEVDTGIGRCGFLHHTASAWLPAVLEAVESDLEWEGTFTHFHSADVEDAEPTREQWDCFQACLAEFPEGRGGLIHTSASASGARWPEYAGDLFRPGLFLYGGVAGCEPIQPQPVVAVRSRVVAVREVPAGWTASYGATYSADRPSRWATLAIGYADGVRRELSNNGFVRFGEREVPIIGRVCMDVTVVDVTDLPAVKAGDVATVIGGPAGHATSLSAVAERCGTIVYEILTGLTQRLPRRYTHEGAAVGA
ncbi:MAG TPA: alanine racemase [Gemmatimonadota bacterium]|nr:alanine racemase [Gemmatimonadota bacterium]